MGTEYEATGIEQDLLQTIHEDEEEPIIDIHRAADIHQKMNPAGYGSGMTAAKLKEFPSISEGATKAPPKVDISAPLGHLVSPTESSPQSLSQAKH